MACNEKSIDAFVSVHNNILEVLRVRLSPLSPLPPSFFLYKQSHIQKPLSQLKCHCILDVVLWMCGTESTLRCRTTAYALMIFSCSLRLVAFHCVTKSSGHPHQSPPCDTFPGDR